MGIKNDLQKKIQTQSKKQNFKNSLLIENTYNKTTKVGKSTTNFFFNIEI